MAGDGNFRWFFARGDDPEAYSFGGVDRASTIQAALNDELAEDGFTIVEADMMVPSVRFTFDADSILEHYEEQNEECWSEDGADIFPTPAQKRELESVLEAALDQWMGAHGLRGRTWGFGTIRHQEYIAPAPSSQERPA